jgi:multicomponent Na+:H+ antiporter subunit D
MVIAFPLLFVVLPLAGAFLTVLAGRQVKLLGFSLALAVSLLLTLFSLGMLSFIQNTAGHLFVYKIGGWAPPLGITAVFDSLSAIMLVVVNFVSLTAALYSFRYMDHYTDKWKFYTLFSLMLTGLNGVIISGDLFNLYIFLEIASISGYSLVAFGTEAADLEAAFKYAIMGATASVFILLGIGILYSYTSTLNMHDMALVLINRPQGMLINFVMVLFLFGFGLKAALVPFHAWLPDAHPSAPAPISAMLSGVFIKTLGVYALARVLFNVIGATPRILFVLLICGAVSMVAGACLAIVQRDVKRLLAYSSISQVGLIVMALGIGTPLAILGGLFHLVNHAFAKSLLFLNSGSIDYATGTRDLHKLGGLNLRMPVTAGTNLIGALSVAGIPPLAGFWSKLLIIIAAVQSGHIMLALVVALVSIVTLAYYLKLQKDVFAGKLLEALDNVREVPFPMRLAVITLSVFCLTGGLLLLPSVLPLLQKAAGVLLGG